MANHRHTQRERGWPLAAVATAAAAAFGNDHITMLTMFQIPPNCPCVLVHEKCEWGRRARHHTSSGACSDSPNTARPEYFRQYSVGGSSIYRIYRAFENDPFYLLGFKGQADALSRRPKKGRLGRAAGRQGWARRGPLARRDVPLPGPSRTRWLLWVPMDNLGTFLASWSAS